MFFCPAAFSPAVGHKLSRSHQSGCDRGQNSIRGITASRVLSSSPLLYNRLCRMHNKSAESVHVHFTGFLLDCQQFNLTFSIIFSKFSFHFFRKETPFLFERQFCGFRGLYRCRGSARIVAAKTHVLYTWTYLPFSQNITEKRSGNSGASFYIKIPLQ